MVRENALTMNCSLIFKSKRQYIVHLFFLFFSLTIKDKTKISLTIKILHLRQSSFTRKVRTIFTLNIIVSIFVKLFLILVLHLRQFFIVRIFVKRATDARVASCKTLWWYCKIYRIYILKYQLYQRSIMKVTRVDVILFLVARVPHDDWKNELYVSWL